MAEDEAAPAAFDEEDATRLAKKMKVDELRAALEAAGADTEGTKPALVERLVAAQRAAASPQPMEEDSDDAPMETLHGRGGKDSGDEAEEAEAAPAAFDEEEATRRAKKMKVEELRAALEAAGEDTEGTKPVLAERAVAAARARPRRRTPARTAKKATTARMATPSRRVKILRSAPGCSANSAETAGTTIVS